jgi:peptidoglycan/LPS O-acetylase OafA/YrhL
MLTDFYTAFSALRFTLLGLWLMVVQSRLSEWQASPAHRRRSYGVALHFSLPGIMSLLALIDPGSKPLWRTSFAVVAIGGAVVMVAVRGLSGAPAAPRTARRSRGQPARAGSLVSAASIRSCGSSKSCISPDR